MHDTLNSLQHAANDFPAITRNTLEILQVNLGYVCNLSCTHCHVNAGPKRTELMDKTTLDLVLDFIRREAIHTLDLTGGAPEMNPHFSYVVTHARAMGVTVIDRCNLVILEEPGYETLAEFLASNKVQIVASLPCYLEDNVDKQRGKGTFNASLAALKKLNPDMKSGCMNDEIDKNVFPDEIIYDTCSGYTTYGEPVKDQAGGGRNEFILSGTVNGIERKWISHKKVTNNAEEKASEKLFNSINSGVYGAVTHSNPDQATDMMRFMDFIHEKDPTGEKSRTVSEIINQKLLPEKYINPY